MRKYIILLLTVLLLVAVAVTAGTVLGQDPTETPDTTPEATETATNTPESTESPTPTVTNTPESTETATATLTTTPTETAEATGEPLTGSFVNSVPGLTLDVYADGQRVLSNVTPGSVIGPVTQPFNNPSGVSIVTIVPAGADSSQILASLSVPLVSGSNVSVIAHLGPDGLPRLTLFDLNASPPA
jgi:cytoskeletal protein RodZ